jgi:hypothetical protein
MWFPLLGSGGLPFLLVGPIVVVAWIRRRRRLADDWARLDAQEQAERGHWGTASMLAAEAANIGSSR